jgi:hypothetical protein
VPDIAVPIEQRSVVDRLKAIRGPGENYSDVILRVAKATS